MDLDWLTATTIPWWGTVLPPIVTFWLGHYMSNRSAKEQREADAKDREKERASNFNTIKEQLRSERAGEEAARRDEAERARKDRIAADFDAALTGISALQTAFIKSAVTPRPVEDEDGTPTGALKDVAEPVPAEAVLAFTAGMNRLRLHVGDKDIMPSDLLHRIHIQIEMWPAGGPWRRVDELMEELSALSDRITSIFRVRHGLQ